LGAPHRGCGYATESAAAVVAWLFDQAVATHLTWEAIVGNEASIRVARKLGFRFAGTRPAAEAFRDEAHPTCWRAELHSADKPDENVESWQALKPAG
jgi:RimJ/RimL family protein N-acetyltransferase